MIDTFIIKTMDLSNDREIKNCIKVIINSELDLF